MVLYRKYRPQNFAAIVGQEHVKEPFLASLKSGKLSHAYLFTGPRGTGKTSIARIVAKAINCERNDRSKNELFSEPCNRCSNCVAITNGSHLDIMEIDAASNRGIDEIRDLREKVKLLPAAGKYKVYIIDEAHMLTAEAFNALLKTLEEPPEHSIFILATTEPHKIPATIVSRSTRFDFKVPNVLQIKEKLQSIVKSEKWAIAPQAVEQIAQMAGGAYRDAEVLLEKVASVDVAADLEKTRTILGKQETKAVLNFADLINKGSAKEALIWLDKYQEEGGSVRVLAESCLEILRKLLLLKAGAIAALGVISEVELKELEDFEKTIGKDKIIKLIDKLNQTIVDMRDVSIPQLPLELLIVEVGLVEKSKEKEEKREVKIDTQNDDSSLQEQGEIERINDNKVEEIQTDSKEEKTESKKPVKPSKLLEKLQKEWNLYLKTVKPLNSSVEMFLKNAKPVDLDDELLTLEFNYSFHKSKIEEKKYREVVEDSLEKYFGTHLRIKGVVTDKPVEVTAKKEERPAPAEEVDPVSVFGTLD